jgi:hypothetical protein
MNSSQVLTIVAVFAIAFAAFNLIITLDKVGKLTGYAGQFGNATLTVSQIVNVSFQPTADANTWGSGSVNSGQYAVLWNNGTVRQGTWASATTSPLIIENYGDVNATVNLTSNVSAATFIGGGNPVLPAPFFRWKVNNSEANSCGGVLGVGASYVDIAAGSPVTICNNLSSFGYPTRNSLAVHLELDIPSNAPGGGKAALLTLTAASIE